MAPAGKLDFDHVALATRDATPALELFVGRLGATDLYGAADRGFRWALLHAGDAERGMLVELLEPWSVEKDPFLGRFLERRGEGAHHLTFKTKDIGETIAALRRAGILLVDQRLENPTWREVFVRPRDAHGTIVQLVETTIMRPPLADMLSAARGPEPGALDVLAGGTGGQVAERWWTSPERRGHPVVLSCACSRLRTRRPRPGLRSALGGRAHRVQQAGQDRARVAVRCACRFERAGGDPTGIVAFEFDEAAVEPCRIGQTAVIFGPSRP